MEKYLQENFEVPSKNPSDEAQRRWRSAVGTLVKNRRRRFRHVPDLDQRQQDHAKRRSVQEKIRVALYVQQAAITFIGGAKKNEYQLTEDIIKARFSINPEELSSITSKHDLKALKMHGGVDGISKKVRSTFDHGVCATDLDTRQSIYGVNRYAEKPSRSFWSFVWDALQDTTLIILMVCALLSVVVGLASEGWPKGMYDGLGIKLSILLLVMVTAASVYKQSLLFKELQHEKENTFIHVTRDSMRQKILISEVVVGDIVHLSIGDQVPADGLLIHGCSLLIDESSLTGDSNPVYISEDKPFILAGTKVQDGSAKMIVTAVGMHTEWGRLMSSLMLNAVGDQVPADGLFIRGYNLLINKFSLTSERNSVYISEDKPFILAGTKVQDGSVKMIVTAVGMHTEWGRLMSSFKTSTGKTGLVFATLTFIVLMARFLIEKDSTVGLFKPSVVQTTRFLIEKGSIGLSIWFCAGGWTIVEYLQGYSDAEDRSSIFYRSHNGKFKRKIRSWTPGIIPLGSGSFGTVYEAISDEGVFFALKEVSLRDQGSNAQQCIFQLEQEIALLSQFEHENIVQYYGTHKEDSKLYIFLELVTQGSLVSLYRKYCLQDTHVSAYTRQILNGLTYLHERDIVHRDIKCANILVHANGSVKLADFGLAKQASELNGLKSCKGSAYWMAPEVVHPKKTYGLAADIWSLGCTVLEMLTRKHPYPDMEWQQALFRIGHGEPPAIPSTLSRDARDFISQCVNPNPEDRPSASKLLDHPFVNRSIRL